MGVDIVSVGMRHKLRVRKPLDLIEDISSLFNANIQVLYYNNKREESYVSLLDFKKKSATENLTIELPRSNYLQQHTSPKSQINVDIQSDLLIKELWEILCNSYGYYDIRGFSENENIEIRIFRETIELDMDSPYRWYGFIEYFTIPKEYNYSGLDEYRMDIKKYAEIVGSEFVIYFPDQYQGELIFDKINLPADELLTYINERKFYGEMGEYIKRAKKEGRHQFSRFDENWAEENIGNSIIFDIPDFILNNREPISNDFNIDVLYDDFRDLNSDNRNLIYNQND